MAKKERRGVIKANWTKKQIEELMLGMVRRMYLPPRINRKDGYQFNFYVVIPKHGLGGPLGDFDLLIELFSSRDNELREPEYHSIPVFLEGLMAPDMFFDLMQAHIYLAMVLMCNKLGISAKANHERQTEL